LRPRGRKVEVGPEAREQLLERLPGQDGRRQEEERGVRLGRERAVDEGGQVGRGRFGAVGEGEEGVEGVEGVGRGGRRGRVVDEVVRDTAERVPGGLSLVFKSQKNFGKADVQQEKVSTEPPLERGAGEHEAPGLCAQAGEGIVDAVEAGAVVLRDGRELRADAEQRGGQHRQVREERGEGGEDGEAVVDGDLAEDDGRVGEEEEDGFSAGSGSTQFEESRKKGCVLELEVRPEEDVGFRAGGDDPCAAVEGKGVEDPEEEGGHEDGHERVGER
jgi:hypothetical protein